MTDLTLEITPNNNPDPDAVDVILGVLEKALSDRGINCKFDIQVDDSLMGIHDAIFYARSVPDAMLHVVISLLMYAGQQLREIGCNYSVSR